MMNKKPKYNERPRIKSLQDIRFEKEKSKYELLLYEQALFTSSRQLRSSVRTTFRSTVNYVTQTLVTTLLTKLFQKRDK